MRKKTLKLIVGLLILYSCSDNQDEYDKSLVVEKLKGDWIISTSFSGFMINDSDTIRVVPINYPTYKISMTSNRAFQLFSIENSIEQLLVEGSFDINTGHEIIFDKIVSEKLNDIGYFKVEPASEKYRITKLNATDFNLEYTYITSDNNEQYDGFFIKRM